MKRTMVAMATLVLLGASVGIFIPQEAEAAASAPVRFGMQANTIDQQTAAGVKPDLGVLWVGPWTLKHGWGGPNDQMAKMSSAGVTPTIHFYYWGDDISPSCVENGCWSSLHNTWKSKDDWQRLAQQLVNNLDAKMGGKPVVILMETEFNKGGIQNYEPFDGYLAAKADFIKKHYPNAEIVMALGNWNSGAWGTFDRAAAASDHVGLQGMRGSTRDSASSYANLYESTLSGARTAKSLFGKPIFIQDIALSSYPEPDYVQPQAKALQKFFTGLPELKNAGVQTIIYRAWSDTPTMDTANYYGKAERHWGLTYAYSGDYKPSAHVWIKGVQAERSSSSGSTSPGSFSAAFHTSDSVNEWWADVSIKGNQPVAKAWIKVDDSPWYSMQKSSWGSWTKSMHIEKGSSVVFRAQSTHGEYATSNTVQWLGGSAPSPPPEAFDAKFHTADSVNEWWVDVSIKGNQPIAKAWVKVNGGPWHSLSKSDWGSWTKSMRIQKGSSVVFRAQSTQGAYDNSDTVQWLGGSAPSPPPAAFDAKFHTADSVNEWWIDVSVKGNQPVAKAWVKVNSGPWYALSESDWGTWTKSMSVPKGSTVVFRAQSTHGDYDTSQAVSWMQGSAFTATFTPRSVGNDWWIDTDAKGSKAIAKVEVRVNGGSWVTLDKTDWGTYAKSVHAPNGATVLFKATSSSGEIAKSTTYKW